MPMEDELALLGEDLDCMGCGIRLQLDEPSQPGFVPLSALTKEPVLCQRCFRIRNYNEISRANVSPDSFLNLLDGIGKTRALVLWVIDLFDLEGSMLSGLRRFIGNNPVIATVNKIDLFDKGTNRSRVEHAIYRRLKEEGVNVQEVVLTSARKGNGLEPLLDAVARHRAGKNIYVIGATNVGKSSLINRLIRSSGDLELELTVSRYPGTTLDAIHIPMEDGGELIDTPGIVNAFRVSEMVDADDLKVIMPENPIKPKVFQLNPEQSLFLGGFVRADFVSGERQSFTVYVSNDLNIHRTKLERADHMTAEHRGSLLVPPSRETLDADPERWAWKRHSLRIAPGKSRDIVIPGLGWIRINDTSGCTIDVYAPAGAKVIVREALLGKPPVLEAKPAAQREGKPERAGTSSGRPFAKSATAGDKRTRTDKWTGAKGQGAVRSGGKTDQRSGFRGPNPDRSGGNAGRHGAPANRPSAKPGGQGKGSGRK